MIFAQRFDTMDEYFRFITTAKNNDVFAGRDESETNSQEFTGTKDFAEAARLFKDGWDSGLEKINASNVDKISSVAPKAIMRNYYVGGCPNVARAMQGLPDAMRQVYRQPQKQRVASIIIDCCVSGGTNKKEYQKIGGYIYQAIRALEISGLRVEIISTFVDEISRENSSAEKVIICPEVLLKRASEPIDSGRLSFALVHMGFFRRLGFKYIETCPCEKFFGDSARNYSHWGYGHVGAHFDDVAEEYGKYAKRAHKNSAVLYISKLTGKVKSPEDMLEIIKKKLEGNRND